MKIVVKDSNEEVVEIEETDEVEVQLSEEDLAALKKLLPVVDQVLALIKTKSEDEEEVVNEDSEEEETDDSEEEEVDDSQEEKETKDSIDKSKKKKKETDDSFKSLGAIHEDSKKQLADSDELELSVSAAWDKRYKK